MTGRIVIIESPYAARTRAGRLRNDLYLRACIRDCIARGEAPFASHRMYTDALNDNDPTEREQGILAGFAFRQVADAVVVYTDLGISAGMARAIELSTEDALPVERRRLYGQ